MQDKFENITIALAGMVQAISLIREIAQTGKTNEPAFQTSINSLFQTHPENITAVYGKIEDLQLGFEKLLYTLNSVSETSRLTTRHMLSLMSLQKKIFNSPKVLDTLTQRIQQAKKQADYFTLTHPLVIANLADIYLDVINPFQFRFFILGNQHILNVDENMEKIRALLLAAVRSSLLWRQAGGSRIQLLFSRSTIKTFAANLLKKLSEGNHL